jgi:hypothetical protein
MLVLHSALHGASFLLSLVFILVLPSSSRTILHIPSRCLFLSKYLLVHYPNDSSGRCTERAHPFRLIFLCAFEAGLGLREMPKPWLRAGLRSQNMRAWVWKGF